MSITDFEKNQQATEIVLAYVDNLIEQGNSRAKAIDHAVQRFGCDRAKLCKLLNERDYGILGTSGETEFFVVSTPSVLAGTA